MNLELGKNYFIEDGTFGFRSRLRIRLSGSWIIISIQKLKTIIEEIKKNPPSFFTENDIEILEELIKRHGDR